MQVCKLSLCGCPLHEIASRASVSVRTVEHITCGTATYASSDCMMIAAASMPRAEPPQKFIPQHPWRVDIAEYRAVNAAADRIPRSDGSLAGGVRRIEAIAKAACVENYTACLILGLVNHPICRFLCR
jgi:hypothetical protein